jgi:hypothetical protein
MNERNMRMIAELIKHLEALDADDIKSEMAPKVTEVEISAEPMEGMEMEGDQPKEVTDPEEELSDEDFEDLLNQSK